MDEVPSNQDGSELRPFFGEMNGAMFANHGEQSAGCSSPGMGRGRSLGAQAALHDMAVVGGDSRLGLGSLDSANLFGDQSLAAAFGNLSFADGAADSAPNSMDSSADRPRNGPFQSAFTRDDLVPSPLTMIGNAEHMRPRAGGQNPSVFRGMPGLDDAYVTVPPPAASPFQQQFYVGRYPHTYAPYQHQQVASKFRWPDTDAEKKPFLMHSQYSYQQTMPQVPPGPDVHWMNSNQCGAVNSSVKPAASPHLRMPIDHHRHLGHGSPDFYWNGVMVPGVNNQLNPVRGSNCPCIIYPDCSCDRCEYCQIQLSEKFKHQCGLRRSPQGLFQNHTLDKGKLRSSPEKILIKSEGVNSIRNIKPGFALEGSDRTNKRMDRHGRNNLLSVQNNDSLHFDLQSSPSLSSLGSDFSMKSPQLIFNSLDEVAGELYLLAKDQNGCRFLQKIFTEGCQEDAQKVFDAVIEHIDELMVDPFGNYLVQKLLEECNDDQKMHIIYEITRKPGQLIKVSCNMHGTRVVQKVIETINTSAEVSMVVTALSPGVINLMMDANGSHVAHRCLQHLSPEYKAFLLNAAIEFCVELAKDRQGCCIIQKCILHANKEQKNRFLYNITSRALDLAEHQYGNYVIQYILDLKVTWATDEVLDKLEGHYGYLSTQKCGSNVVEKCLKEAREPKRLKIIHELINDPKLLQIMLDQYGNYVIQTALRECKNAAVHAELVRAISPHTAALRNNMYGKRILSKTGLKNKKY